MDEIGDYLAARASAVFGYCVKRLGGDISRAEELSQDIFLASLCGLRRSEIRNRDAWLWQVAANRLARFVRRERYDFVSFDADPAFDVAEPADEDMSAELSAAFEALHGIASEKRGLLVDFYVRRLSLAQLGAKYGITANAAELRLRAARKLLRERWNDRMENSRIYEKLDWSISCNGNMDPYRYLSRQTCRAVCLACYDSPATVEEISRATGLPCMYIEDELPELLYGEAVREYGSRGGAKLYAADFILETLAMRAESRQIAADGNDALTSALVGLFRERENEIRSVGFTGADKPSEKLLWLYLPVAFRKAADAARARHTLSARPSGDFNAAAHDDVFRGLGGFRPRKDGGCGWFIVREGSFDCASGLNGYFIADHRFSYYWTNFNFSEAVNSLLHRLEHEPADALASPELLSEQNLADAVSLGLVKNGESPVWDICVFTPAQARSFYSIIDSVSDAVSPLLDDRVAKLYGMFVGSTPRRLRDQISGIFGASVNDAVSVMLSSLPPPTFDPVPCQICLVL